MALEVKKALLAPFGKAAGDDEIANIHDL